MTEIDTLLRPPRSPFEADMLAGLSASPKATLPIWFYDHAGSELFEAITRLPEYYPTRAETAILTAEQGALAAAIGPNRCVVEFGAGSLAKTPLLLAAIDPVAYVPVDISGPFLRESAAVLQADFPDLPIMPVEADFTQPFALPAVGCPKHRLGFFPGSTIGNFDPAAAVDLLRSMRESLGDESLLLIGMDRVKGADILIPAYDDAAGVTAAFNLNLLARLNREAEADFRLEGFAHLARWNEVESRIEMRLRSLADQTVHVAGRPFGFVEGETIHTENSYKYAPERFEALAEGAGWSVVDRWTSPQPHAFGLFLLRAA